MLMEQSINRVKKNNWTYPDMQAIYEVLMSISQKVAFLLQEMLFQNR